MIHSRNSENVHCKNLKNLIECKSYKYEKKMNHKTIHAMVQEISNMPFFEINDAGSIVALD